MEVKTHEPSLCALSLLCCQGLFFSKSTFFVLRTDGWRPKDGNKRPKDGKSRPIRTRPNQKYFFLQKELFLHFRVRPAVRPAIRPCVQPSTHPSAFLNLFVPWSVCPLFWMPELSWIPLVRIRSVVMVESSGPPKWTIGNVDLDRWAF